MKQKKIFLYDFIGGWLDRGIPLYTRNLKVGLENSGWRVHGVFGSKIFRKLPKIINHLIAIFIEQLICPIAWRLLNCDRIIYPYNSISLIDIFDGRAHIIIHDVAIFKYQYSKAAKLYYIPLYWMVRLLKKPIFTISEVEIDRLREYGFKENQIKLLPNLFTNFRSIVNIQRSKKDLAAKKKTVLLCTGIGWNKNLEYVINKLIPAILEEGWHVEVLGIGNSTSTINKLLDQNVGISKNLTILPVLNDVEVVQAYLRSTVVWVHSLQEGFGRCVVEGRIAGKPVICNQINEFVQLADESVFFYEDELNIVETLRIAIHSKVIDPYVAYNECKIFADAINEL